VLDMRNLFIVCVLIWMPAALGSECYSIQDTDQRNACLASSKNDNSYCYKIQSKDLQKDCLAHTPR
jgi:hypothetical protein